MTDRITKILVANRGEIALRIIRTAQEMGIATVAVYADQDRTSMACERADETAPLSDNTARAYMNEELLIDIARRTGADAVHPGYGFLSENAHFAQLVKEAGLVWIGPDADVIERLGDKIAARHLADAVHVPTIPGLSDVFDGSHDNSVALVNEFAETHGYPLLIKQSDAGGGRGIVRIDTPDELAQFLSDRADVVRTGTCFVEKLMEKCRHVETQCMRDAQGTFVCVSTRDCSVQRRRQKVVEEAPAPRLAPAVEQQIGEYSRALFEKAGYVGVGTCEFLLDPQGNLYFLEVNPRLQVEHTVSEEVTGFDLVREQIRIAQGQPCRSEDREEHEGRADDADAQGGADEGACRTGVVRGCAIEVRITSEDPTQELMPATGVVRSIQWPAGPGVRIDSHIRAGEEIGGAFDSLIGKITVWAGTRLQAIERMSRALSEVRIEGVPTCIPVLQRIISDPAFAQVGAAGGAHITWLEESGILNPDHYLPTQSASAQPSGSRQDGRTFTIRVDSTTHEVNLPNELLAVLAGGGNGGDGHVRRPQPLRATRTVVHADTHEDHGGAVTSPIQANVVRVACEAGQHVDQGEPLVVIEAMKMEKLIHAPCAGTVDTVSVAVGQTVAAGDLLVRIDPDQRQGEEES